MDLQEEMNQFIAFMQKYEYVHIPDLEEFNEGILNYQKKIKDIKMLPEEKKREQCSYLIEHVEHFQELIQIYIYSMLAYFFEENNVFYVGKILDLTINSPLLVVENRYFIYNQLEKYGFHWEKGLGADNAWKNRMMYRDIYYDYRKLLGITPDVVPIGERNKRVVVFVISQFLNELHGPTKTVLDRCEVIAEKMGATPVIFNTMELSSYLGYIPYYLPYFGNYLESLQNVKEIQYHGKSFLYYQCSVVMPNTKEVMDLLETVKQWNPYCIIQIGGNSICADLCSNYYPVITVGTVPSSIMTSEGQFMLKGSSVTDKDREYIQKLGFSENYLQYCLFTSSYKEQTRHFTRQQYGIPQNVFTIVIVGARLDYEVNDSFIEEVLIPVMEQGVMPVFVGVFDAYHKKAKMYPLLQDKSVFVGFVDDILAVDELCDVYVNPRRSGGGTSVVEAMAKKLPPVSLDYGDVALGAGEEFCVVDYSEMVERILRLRDDAEYYAKMSEKAYERMKYVTNSQKIFWEAFQRIENLPEFQ